MNEPVAFVTGVRQFDPVMADTVLKVGTPLYSHPSKDLTDEEIWKLWQKHLSDDIPVFARAVIKEANEK